MPSSQHEDIRRSRGVPYGLPAAKLFLASYPWFFGCLVQGIQLVFALGLGKREDPDSFLHIIGLLSFGLSGFLLFNFPKVIAGNEDRRALVQISIRLFVMGILGIGLLVLAATVPADRLLKYPSLFRNLVAVTGSFRGAALTWVAVCGAVFMMGILVFRKPGRAKG